MYGHHSSSRITIRCKKRCFYPRITHCRAICWKIIWMSLSLVSLMSSWSTHLISSLSSWSIHVPNSSAISSNEDDWAMLHDRSLFISTNSRLVWRLSSLNFEGCSSRGVSSLSNFANHFRAVDSPIMRYRLDTRFASVSKLKCITFVSTDSNNSLKFPTLINLDLT